jgi:hypothetical protein
VGSFCWAPPPKAGGIAQLWGTCLCERGPGFDPNIAKNKIKVAHDFIVASEAYLAQA